jgi:3'-phosphoadenosine 5'-phosphosulfate sulfotransferase (PAPS reductase)/FAD synthetase
MCRLATLEQWQQYGIQGSVNYGKPALALPYRRTLPRKVDAAIARIEDLNAVTDGRWYVSVSFGVDSLAAYHLARQINPDVIGLWVNQGPFAEWPDCLALKDLMTAQGMRLVELEPDISLMDWYRANGIPLAAGMTSKDDKDLNEDLMYAPIRRYNESAKMQGHAWGLRAQGENRRRGMLISQKGEIYQRKDGFWVASPVARWSKAEIFAYLDSNALPYPAMYDLNRAEIRNGPPIGTTGVNLGRIAKLKQYFPQIYRVFAAEFPEIQRFA